MDPVSAGSRGPRWGEVGFVSLLVLLMVTPSPTGGWSLPSLEGETHSSLSLPVVKVLSIGSTGSPSATPTGPGGNDWWDRYWPLSASVGLSSRNTINVGQNPNIPAADTYTGRVYSSNAGPSNLSIIDPSTHQVEVTMPVGTHPYWSPEFDPADGNVYVPNEWSDSVSVISGATETPIAYIPVGLDPWWPIYDPATPNDTLYVANANSGNVSVISGTQAAVVASIPVGGQPWWPVVDPVTNQVFVPGPTNNVTVIDGYTNRVVAVLRLPGNALPGVFDSANGDLYFPAESAGKVSVVSGATDRILANLTVGASPVMPTYVPANGEIYVPNLYSANISVISGGNNTVLRAIPVGGSPEPPVVDPLTDELYVANSASANVSVIDSGTDAVIATIPVGADPHWPVYDDRDNTVYVPNSGAATISLIPGGCGSSGTLCYASVSPATGPLRAGQTEQVTATVHCTGGACPGGIVYHWSVSNGLASVSPSAPSPDPVANLTAGANTGEFVLRVTAAWNGTAVNSTGLPIVITLPPPPSLVNVSIWPPAAQVAPGQTVNLTALLSCPSSGCPTNIQYAWGLNNSLGTLSSTTANCTQFQAGPLDGSVTVTVLATSGTARVSSSSQVRILANAPAVIESVSVRPSQEVVPVNGSATLYAQAVCTGGQACPKTTVYEWSAPGALVTLTPATGASTHLRAGASPGFLNVTVVAIAEGRSASAQVAVRVSGTPVPGLAKVSIQSSSVRLDPGGNVTLLAVPTCSPSACQAGMTYYWSLSDHALASLNTTSSPVVRLTWGSALGSESVTVEATLNDVSVSSSPLVLSVQSPSHAGVPATWIVAILAGAGLLALALVVWVLSRRRRAARSGRGGPTPHWSTSPTEETPHRVEEDHADSPAGDREVSGPHLRPPQE